MWRTRVTSRLAAISIASVLLLSAVFMYGTFSIYRGEAMKTEREKPVAQAIAPRRDQFKDLALGAQAAYVYDVKTKRVLYEKNADVALPLASITKTMTAIVAEEEAKKTGQDTVTIGENALLTEGESGLQAGERWSVKDLLGFTLVSSSNDGATALADANPEFIELMNSKAAELGLDTLRFRNPTGLDIEDTNDTGGYGSAKDVAGLLEYAIKEYPELLESTTHSRGSFASETLRHEAKNTNTILTDIPNSIASKTGYTLKAGGNLAMVFDRGLNEPVILVVLGSTYDGRFSDIALLASTTLKTYNQSQ